MFIFYLGYTSNFLWLLTCVYALSNQTHSYCNQLFFKGTVYDHFLWWRKVWSSLLVLIIWSSMTNTRFIWHSIPFQTQIGSQPKRFMTNSLTQPSRIGIHKLNYWRLWIQTKSLLSMALWHCWVEPVDDVPPLSRMCGMNACRDKLMFLMVSQLSLFSAPEGNGFAGRQWSFQEFPLFSSGIQWRWKPSSASWHGQLTEHCPRGGIV